MSSYEYLFKYIIIGTHGYLYISEPKRTVAKEEADIRISEYPNAKATH